ncbi:hypothetical protein LF817_14525 [Halobacillus sp. A1]|uniref:hypothetical protein n=1 Tax=Halobacillus sp. A1 TaxID=2880262 RepID=UPI0020A69754|nr:hypothetical protein [Halobacillus sp. A1]MCP3032540.1 hypothetical protein [Halobacillus sp. A1]
MSTGVWVLIIIVGVLTLPIVVGMIRDRLGFSANTYYGDTVEKTPDESKAQIDARAACNSQRNSAHVPGGWNPGE